MPRIEPLPAVTALKRAHDEELIAQWLATHKVERVQCIIQDVDVRSVLPEKHGQTYVAPGQARYMRRG